MKEESFVVYEHNSYDMMRTWRSVASQQLGYPKAMESEGQMTVQRMNDAMHLVVDPRQYVIRLFPWWKLKDDF